MVSRARLPHLYASVGKLCAEINDFDEALRLLETKLDDNPRMPSLREIYYGALRKRNELKISIDASLREIHSHARHRRNAIVAKVART